MIDRYRALCKKFHPDNIYTGNSAIFKVIIKLRNNNNIQSLNNLYERLV